MHNGNAAAEGKSFSAREVFTFDSILDKACERLLDRQAEYSIRRIRELEERLCSLEDELDEFLRSCPPAAARRGQRRRGLRQTASGPTTCGQTACGR